MENKIKDIQHYNCLQVSTKQELIDYILKLYKGYSIILGKWIIGELIVHNDKKVIHSNLEDYVVVEDSIEEITGEN